MSPKLNYDLPTAVTFFLAGLGMGAVLAVILAPRADAELASANHTLAANAPQSAAL